MLSRTANSCCGMGATMAFVLDCADTENNVSGSADISHQAAHERKQRLDMIAQVAIQSKQSIKYVCNRWRFRNRGKGRHVYPSRKGSCRICSFCNQCCSDCRRRRCVSLVPVSHASASAAARWHRSRGRVLQRMLYTTLCPVVLMSETRLFYS